MLFFIDDTFNLKPAVLTLAQNHDFHIYVWKKPSQKAEPLTQASYQLLTYPKSILGFIKASLKDGKNVIITEGDSLPSLDSEFLKKRLYTLKDNYIFMTPRAGFFFSGSLDRIRIETYNDLEELTTSWGK